VVIAIGASEVESVPTATQFVLVAHEMLVNPPAPVGGVWVSQLIPPSEVARMEELLSATQLPAVAHETARRSESPTPPD
jgi:hypothetical protein